MAAIYQADIWCDSCADAIRTDLDKAGHTPEGPSDEYSYDSDEYPKGVGDPGESDSPSHCGAGGECLEAEELPSGYKIGALLSDELTEDGEDYVREAIAEGGEVAEFWSTQFYV